MAGFNGYAAGGRRNSGGGSGDGFGQETHRTQATEAVLTAAASESRL